MADQTNDSTVPSERAQKRPRDDEGEGLPIVKKLAKDPELLLTQITDLNTYCFEHLFKYLKLNDLFVLCNLNANSIDAARAVFSQRYSEHLVQIGGKIIPKQKPIVESKSKIIISAAPDYVKFLRVFGEQVKKLEIQNLSNENLKTDWLEIKSLFDKKCVATLTEFKINNCGTDLMNGVQNVFVAVESLDISCSRLGKCNDLSKWFPNVKQLKLELMHSSECYDTERNKNNSLFGPQKTCLPMSDVVAMFKSTPQLNELKIRGRSLNTNFLRYINKMVPMLKKLDIEVYDFDDDEKGKVFFKNLEVFSMSKELPYCAPFKFEKLTELIVNADYLYSDWIELATENEHLTKLTIDAHYHKTAVISDSTLADIATKLIKLTELKITTYHVKRKGLTSFLSKCKSLQKLTIEYDDSKVDFSPLFEKPRSKWRIVSEFPLVLERKSK